MKPVSRSAKNDYKYTEKPTKFNLVELCLNGYNYPQVATKSVIK